MINSGEFTGTPGDVAKPRVTEWLQEKGLGRFDVQYRLHDWLISRQRYWGAPIPMVYCDQCGVVPEKYENLPVILPTDAQVPSTGENAPKFHEGFLHTTCPRCGGPGRRETDTMDTFMCSSWYQYAYVSPYWKAAQKLSADDLPWDGAKGDYWLPVDQYTGGHEHATMHLLYTRFFTKALADMGIVNFREPMLRLFNQGIILGPDGLRMSKSRGNVVAPDSYVEKYGADTVRAYLMFIGPWDAGGPWNFTGIEGVKRFLERVWAIATETRQAGTAGDGADGQLRELRHMTHKTLQNVSEDVDAFKWNTVISALMEFNNYLIKARDTEVVRTWAWNEAIDTLLLMMAPAMPHIAEELWQGRHPADGFTADKSIHVHPWPQYDPELAKADVVTLVVQVNGKVRDRIEAPAGITEDQAQDLALASPSVQKWIEDKRVRKVIFAGGKLINIVVA
jgi:leucyl-tRNA synthetase